MGILARLRLAKIRTIARPNSPDMPPKRTKKVRLGILSAQFFHHMAGLSTQNYRITADKKLSHNVSGKINHICFKRVYARKVEGLFCQL